MCKGSGAFKDYDKKQIRDENQVDKLLQSPRKQGQWLNLAPPMNYKFFEIKYTMLNSNNPHGTIHSHYSVKSLLTHSICLLTV